MVADFPLIVLGGGLFATPWCANVLHSFTEFFN
jgi:hypothetical protein